ncbi:Uncharacterised protein [Dermatophilus congolensis]|uniref:Uncharacterized protein n=1 Tax=Dermatophilus congolensis TaxID=1863 RepID=A0AA46BQ04_9MICO|nr:hypothetical protein [Dermatophilus congolensis]STD14505.1 Uncharacterised protein [Dermatophilus congolensis]
MSSPEKDHHTSMGEMAEAQGTREYFTAARQAAAEPAPLLQDLPDDADEHSSEKTEQQP